MNLRLKNLTKRHKRSLGPKKEGLFKIILRKIPDTANKLDLPETMRCHPVFQVSLLRRYVDPAEGFPSRWPKTPEPIIVDGEAEYEIEKILQDRVRRVRNRIVEEFLVKWRDFPDSHNEWLIREQLIGEYDENSVLKLFEFSISAAASQLGRRGE